jgi:hypothetical protein
MRYDAWLSRGGGERRVLLDIETRFEEGDEFKYELEVFRVTKVEEGHGPFDAVLFAELIGDKPQ